MDPRDWLQKAQVELNSLATDALDDPEDAWRAVVLIARLLGSPNALSPPTALMVRLPALLATAGVTDAEAAHEIAAEILEAVAEELETQEEPWGPLLDALLDADDTLGVLNLVGLDDLARALSQRVAALTSLYPERVLSLDSFAAMRLQTVRAEATVAEVWRSIERSPAQILAGALPVQTPAAILPAPTRHEQAPAVPQKAAPTMIKFALPESLHQAAADSSMSDVSHKIETGDPELRAWIYAEEGQMCLEISGFSSKPREITLIAERRTDGQALSRMVLPFEFGGQTAYADLGPWSGPENCLHRLVADSKVSADTLQIRLSVLYG